MRDIRLRRLARDVRDMKLRLRAVEVRRAAEAVLAIEHDSPVLVLPEAVVVPQRLAEEAKPRIKSGVTGLKAARAPIPQAERIALPGDSAMERRFVTSVMGPVGSSMADAGILADAKVYCGPCGHCVPTWLGRDCITVGCPLKVRA